MQAGGPERLRTSGPGCRRREAARAEAADLQAPAWAEGGGSGRVFEVTKEGQVARALA